MDLDLARVRGFVAVADEGHFGRAAASLSISQQALSKRIAALEAELGARLLNRGVAGAELTEPGRLFLEPARRLLAAADAAAAAVTGPGRPLRIGVWGHLFQPMRTMRAALAHAPELEVELGPERDLPAVAAALGRGEIDVGLGRVHGGGQLARAGLAHRLVRLEPLDAILGAGHVLARRDQLRPADLAGSTLMFPAAGGRLDFLSRFADEFAVGHRSYGTNAGPAAFVAWVRANPSGFSLLPADLATSVRKVPVTGPVPLYGWSVIWRRDGRHRRVPQLLEAFAAAGRASRWLEFRPGLDWLTPAEAAQLTEQSGTPGPPRRG